MPAFTAPFLRLRLTPAIGILPFASFTIQKWLLPHTALSPLYSSPRTWRHLFLNGLRTKQSFSYLGCLETRMSDSRSWEAQIKVPGGSLRTKETISWSAGNVIPGEGYSQKNWVGCAARFINTLSCLWPKSGIFPTLFIIWIKFRYTIYDLTPQSIPS